jgi:hypothetical protein
MAVNANILLRLRLMAVLAAETHEQLRRGAQ